MKFNNMKKLAYALPLLLISAGASASGWSVNKNTALDSASDASVTFQLRNKCESPVVKLNGETIKKDSAVFEGKVIKLKEKAVLSEDDKAFILSALRKKDTVKISGSSVSTKGFKVAVVKAKSNCNDALKSIKE